MEELIKSYIDRVEHAFDVGTDHLRWHNREISSLRTKLPQSVFNINGMSTAEVRMFLNELIKDDTNYLEIGIHRGSTFVSAMWGNNPKSAIAIDDFGGPMSADDVKNSFLKNCSDNGVNNFELIHNNSFWLTKEQKDKIKDINVYFYDGGHTFRDHKASLEYYYETLSDCFIFIVDDWVHKPAVDGTFAAIEQLKFKVHKSWEVGHSQHNNIPGKLSWHNGLYVAVLQK